MREDQVKNGVTFLTHPKVKDASMDERLSFLKNKGLTDEEINEAVKRAREETEAETADSGATIPQVPQQTYYQPPPPQESFFSRVIVPGGMALSAGAALAYLYKNMVNPNGMNPYNPNMNFPPNQLNPLAPNQPPQQLPQQPPAQQLPMVPQQINGAPMPNPAAGTDMVVAGDPLYGAAPYANTEVAKRNESAATDDVAKLAKTVEEQTGTLRDVVSSLNSLTTQLSKLEEQMSKNKSAEIPLLISGLNHTNSDVKAELRAVKTLLMANHLQSSGSVASAPATDSISNMEGVVASMDAAEQQLKVHEHTKKVPEPSDKATPPDPMDRLLQASKQLELDEAAKVEKEAKEKSEKLKNEKLATCRQALARMRSDCPSNEKLGPAVNTLLLYLSNLIANWDAKPYGRISTNNPTYVKSLKEVAHHIDFLKACGFEEKPSPSRPTLEFTEDWRKAKDEWAEEVLKDAKKNLEALQAEVKNGGSTVSAATTSTPAAENTTTSFPVPDLQPNPSSVPTTATTTSAPVATNFGGPANATNTSQPMTQPNPTPQSNGVPPSLSQPTSVQSNGGTGTSTSNDKESYPTSFFEISEKLAKDKNWRPPNMKEIPNTLSVDASKFANTAETAPPPKPWEQAEAKPASFDDFLKRGMAASSKLSSGPTVEQVTEDK